MARRTTAQGNRIRVHRDMNGAWVWRLITPDGHIVHESEPFEDRDACEVDALRQGAPVDGLSRKRRTRQL